MQNAGVEGEIYPDFKPFIPEELTKHLGVYVAHGVSPTPELNMRFQSPLNHINKSNYQLHYWATGKLKYSSVAYCKDCRVSICTDKC